MMEEDDDDDEEDFINPLILKDIEKIKKLHGDNCIEHKLEMNYSYPSSVLPSL